MLQGNLDEAGIKAVVVNARYASDLAIYRASCQLHRVSGDA
jgi:hypothetical protein